MADFGSLAPDELASPSDAYQRGDLLRNMPRQHVRGLIEAITGAFTPQRDERGVPIAPGIGDAISAGMLAFPGAKGTNFVERMDQGRALAELARARGIPTGKSAPGWDYKPAPPPEKGTWSRLKQENQSKWDLNSGLAQEDYLRAAYPERYEGFPLLGAAGAAGGVAAGATMADPAQAGSPPLPPIAGPSSFDRRLGNVRLRNAMGGDPSWNVFGLPFQGRKQQDVGREMDGQMKEAEDIADFLRRGGRQADF